MQRTPLVIVALVALLASPVNAQQQSSSTYKGAVPTQTVEHQKAQSNVPFDTKRSTAVTIPKSSATVQQKVQQARTQTANQQKALARKYPAKTSVPPVKHSP